MQRSGLSLVLRWRSCAWAGARQERGARWHAGRVDSCVWRLCSSPMSTSSPPPPPSSCDEGLTHVDAASNQPRMVDVSGKAVTRREAHARSVIDMPEHVMRELSSGDEFRSKKGPVFSTAIVAGVMAVKRTSDLIPFCHPLPVEGCDIDIHAEPPNRVVVDCRVRVAHTTGVEMEALTGASVAALCVYDMCKALSHDIVISDTRLMSKSGGKRPFQREE